MSQRSMDVPLRAAWDQETVQERMPQLQDEETQMHRREAFLRLLLEDQPRLRVCRLRSYARFTE